MTETRLEGRIITMFELRGFGFIKGDDGFTRFFHVKYVDPQMDFDRMKIGTRVSFTPMAGGPQGNKLRAVNVRMMEGSTDDRNAG